MAYTRHGWHIDGSDYLPKPNETQKGCVGGPEWCPACLGDLEDWLSKKYDGLGNTVRIPLVMHFNNESRIIGVAEIIYHNEDERDKFSKSEVIAEAFDIRHEEHQDPDGLFPK